MLLWLYCLRSMISVLKQLYNDKKDLLTSGIIELNLHSNRPFCLDMFSFSNLRCGGKRSWDSYAQSHSDFYVPGIVPGGFGPLDEPGYCCTQ